MTGSLQQCPRPSADRHFRFLPQRPAQCRALAFVLRLYNSQTFAAPLACQRAPGITRCFVMSLNRWPACPAPTAYCFKTSEAFLRAWTSAILDSIRKHLSSIRGETNHVFFLLMTHASAPPVPAEDGLSGSRESLDSTGLDAYLSILQL